MEHFRLRKYRGPKVWAKVREAYEAGESGPSCARRFDVGLANLRKKARLEGWTRRHQAERADRELPQEDAAPSPDVDVDGEEPMDRPTALNACLDHAARAMARGDGQKALAAIKAALAFTEVTRKLDGTEDLFAMEPGRQRALAFLRSQGELG